MFGPRGETQVPGDKLELCYLGPAHSKPRGARPQGGACEDPVVVRRLGHTGQLCRLRERWGAGSGHSAWKMGFGVIFGLFLFFLLMYLSMYPQLNEKQT